MSPGQRVGLDKGPKYSDFFCLTFPKIQGAMLLPVKGSEVESLALGTSQVRESKMRPGLSELMDGLIPTQDLRAILR